MILVGRRWIVGCLPRAAQHTAACSWAHSNRQHSRSEPLSTLKQAALLEKAAASSSRSSRQQLLRAHLDCTGRALVNAIQQHDDFHVCRQLVR